MRTQIFKSSGWAAALAVLLAGVMAASSAHADDDDDEDDDHRGRAQETIKQKHDKYEYKYKDRYCDYKYKYDYRKGEAEVKEKGDCSHIRPQLVGVVQPAPVPRVIPPAAPTTVVRCDRERLGQVLGGLAGAAIGSQAGKGSSSGGRAVATATGAVIGIIIGGEIGRRMDETDQACVAQALEYSGTNQVVRWQNGAATYAVQPGAPLERGGATCRAYTTKLTVDGKTQTVPGQACRQPDGSWRPL